uniref:Uncharacterized protein n=1 Tax=Anopheles maculatus TaxID=74869 RepID=A0A182SBI0_9DIPT
AEDDEQAVEYSDDENVEKEADHTGESCDPDNEEQAAAVGENGAYFHNGDDLIDEPKPESCDDEAAPWNPALNVTTAENDEQAVENSDDANVEKEAVHMGDSCDPDNEEQAAALGENRVGDTGTGDDLIGDVYSDSSDDDAVTIWEFTGLADHDEQAVECDNAENTESGTAEALMAESCDPDNEDPSAAVYDCIDFSSEKLERQLNTIDLEPSLPLYMAEKCDPDNENQAAAVGENLAGDMPSASLDAQNEKHESKADRTNGGSTQDAAVQTDWTIPETIEVIAQSSRLLPSLPPLGEVVEFSLDSDDSDEDGIDTVDSKV